MSEELEQILSFKLSEVLGGEVELIDYRLEGGVFCIRIVHEGVELEGCVETSCNNEECLVERLDDAVKAVIGKLRPVSSESDKCVV